MRLRDTQCGLFATGKVLSRFGVPFTGAVITWLKEDVSLIASASKREARYNGWQKAVRQALTH